MRIIATHAHGRASRALDSFNAHPPHAPGSPLRSAPRLPAVPAADADRGQPARSRRRRDVPRGGRPDHRSAARARRRGGRRLSQRPPLESGDRPRLPPVQPARHARCRSRRSFSSRAITTRRARARRAAFCSSSRSSASTSWIASRSGCRSRPRSFGSGGAGRSWTREAVVHADSNARFNVLAMHCGIEGADGRHGAWDRPPVEVSRVGAERVRRGTTSRSATTTCIARSEPNTFYSGSIDYTSVDTWGERREEDPTASRYQGQGIHRARPRHRRAHVSSAATVAAADRPCRRSTRAISPPPDIDDRIRSIVDACVGRDRRQDRAAHGVGHSAARRARAGSQGDPRVQAPRAELPARPPSPRAAVACTASGAPVRRPSLNEHRARKTRCASDRRRHRSRRADRARASRISTKHRSRPSSRRRRRRSRREMRLNSLHLTNFRQHVDTHIDFTSGITGIIGPNGVRQVDDSRGDRVGALRHARGARHARVDSIVPRRPARRRQSRAGFRARRASISRLARADQRRVVSRRRQRRRSRRRSPR